MERKRVLKDLRLAGGVVRYHTWPVIQRQTVADHTWHVLRIYHAVWGDLPPQIVEYIMYADCGELVLGDLPFPVKRDNPALKTQCNNVEDKTLRSMGIVQQNLGEAIKRRMKICDLIEMHEFGQMERNLGSQLAEPIIYDTLENVHALTKQLSQDEQEQVGRYLNSGELFDTRGK